MTVMYNTKSGNDRLFLRRTERLIHNWRLAMTIMHCLCCNKTLEPVFADSVLQPAEGVVCQTSGNYGSRAFDSFEGEELIFFVCDDCLTTRRERILYRYGRDPFKQDEAPLIVSWALHELGSQTVN